MRIVIAFIVCAAILALSFFLNPILQAKGVPMGGLAMIVISAILAVTWTAITKGFSRKQKASQDNASQTRDGA